MATKTSVVKQVPHGDDGLLLLEDSSLTLRTIDASSRRIQRTSVDAGRAYEVVARAHESGCSIGRLVYQSNATLTRNADSVLLFLA